MGNFMGFMGKGVPSTQMLSLLLGTLHKQFTEREINDFEDFHVAILDILNAFNSALPGKHYDAPSYKEVEECFTRWKVAQDDFEKKKVFIDFMERIKLSQLDNTTMITGIVTPPAAMAAKKAGEFLPHVSIIKAIPDVIFVPSITMAALITSKLSRRILMQNAGS